jgi:uncharacterized protein YqgV (UPF0045/DUF77 family)
MAITISAQVSVYPLSGASLAPAIDAVCGQLRDHRVEFETGTMSTVARGDSERIFAALREGFERAARTGSVVMVVTLSNACPAPEPGP